MQSRLVMSCHPAIDTIPPRSKNQPEDCTAFLYHFNIWQLGRAVIQPVNQSRHANTAPGQWIDPAVRLIALPVAREAVINFQLGRC